MRDAELLPPFCLTASLFERSNSLVFAPLHDVQPGPICDNAFECAETVFACTTDRCRETIDDIIKVTVLQDELLHQRLQAQHLDGTTAPKLPHTFRCITF